MKRLLQQGWDLRSAQHHGLRSSTAAAAHQQLLLLPHSWSTSNRDNGWAINRTPFLEDVGCMLLILDSFQSGKGRTSSWWEYIHSLPFLLSVHSPISELIKDLSHTTMGSCITLQKINSLYSKWDVGINIWPWDPIIWSHTNHWKVTDSIQHKDSLLEVQLRKDYR